MSGCLALEGRAVLVAGGGGLGGACAAGFVRAGARVMVADSDKTRLDDLDRDAGLARSGGGVIGADLSDPAQCRSVVDQAAALLGGLDVFVHSLGINDRRPVLDYSDDDWQRMLTINLSSAFWLGQAAGRRMCAVGHGKLVFISSVSGLLAHQHHGPYAATKGGLNQLLRVMAAEWAAAGVSVNAIAPGYVETPLTQAHLAKPGVRDGLQSLVPAGRLGAPGDVVGPTLFLASPLSDYVTGQVLYVDGGRTLV